jgi:hypothetical protein
MIFTNAIQKDDEIHIVVTDDKRVAEALAMSKGGIGDTLTEEDKNTFNNIGDLSREFQEKNCTSCTSYDPKNNDFISRKHTSCPGQDCEWHYIDIIGQCWNYKPKEIK